MSARELEAALLIRCSVVVREDSPIAQDQREANVFQLASMVIRSRFPRESTMLMLASEQYFATHPGERMTAGDVVRKGWIQNLPRLRDMLNRHFMGTKP